MNLNMHIFESFSFKDIIGELHSLEPEVVKKIEMQLLIKNLKDKNQKDLE